MAAKKANKDVQEIINALRAQGWEVTGGGTRHWKCKAPGGKGLVFMSTSPSDYRSLRNSKAELRRLGAILK